MLQPLAQVARYDLQQDRLPADWNPAVADRIFTLRDLLTSKAPRNLKAAVAATNWRRTEPLSFNLHTFANYRSSYKLIVTMADILAPYYAQYGLLPLIIPLPLKLITDLKPAPKPIYDEIHRRGLILLGG